jgi:nitrite reductase/ring-hydroxylating ferredoxin subunit
LTSSTGVVDYRKETLAERTEVDDPTEVRAGSLAELQAAGQLLTKLGRLPVVVFWHDHQAFAIEDRCPHLGFPLHRGTVESGLLTCHWHHARFDLVSGCTLDLWADDAPAFDVDIRGDDVYVRARVHEDPIAHLRRRLREGLEDGITLVIAKSVLGLLEAGMPAGDIVRTGLEFGTAHRDAGWGAGLTVLVAMSNLLPMLHPEDRALALTHGLAFVARDTRNHAPRFPVSALASDALPVTRLAGWYRRFVDTRSPQSAERSLRTALVDTAGRPDVEAMMFAAVTDHVFIDGGHTLDFTNKAFEALDLVGDDAAPWVLPTLVRQTALAERSEEFSEWRHPHDLVSLAAATAARLEGPAARREPPDVAKVAWELLADDPHEVADAVVRAYRTGATDEEVGRALAFAAALRIVRFHVQNDHGDWDTVHHSFTAANALHRALVRNPTSELRRGCVHAAFRIYLDRFLNVPAARLPTATSGRLDALDRCFETQGMVDEAGNEAYGFLHAGGARSELVAALARALLAEDAEFHWFQVVEAGVRQACEWPEGSDESALVLVAVARFLAAHTPTRRELPTVVRIAARLRRGEALHEDAGDDGA